MLSGVAERDDKARELAAWMTAHAMNISGKTVKKAVTVDSLLGRTAKQFPMSDKEQFAELMRRQALIDEKKKELADGH